jgi:hypothetical protein
MKKLIYFMFLAQLVITFWACSGNNIIQADKLKAGDTLNSFAIKYIANNDTFKLILNNEITLNGNLSIDTVNAIAIKLDSSILQSKIQTKDRIIDLASIKTIFLENAEDLQVLLNRDMFIQKNGKYLIDNKFNDNYPIKITINNYTVSVYKNKIRITANIQNVLTLNNDTINRPSATNLEFYKDIYTNKLQSLLASITQSATSPVSLFFTQDIHDFEYYKTNKDFASYVDKLIKLGYNIEQQEGVYYLSIEKKISKADLTKKLAQYESVLQGKIETLKAQNYVQKTLFFPKNIKDFEFYKKNKDFALYVDQLLTMGYGIEQAEGEYYLYIGQANDYKDGETN